MHFAALFGAMSRLQPTSPLLHTFSVAMLLITVGCASIDGQSIEGGILERSDNGAFTVLLEADHLANAEAGEFYLTVAMPNPSNPESVSWIVPGALVDVEVANDKEVVAVALDISSDADGRHALEAIPILRGQGPWTFEVRIAVDDQVFDSVVFHATP